jgi:hypothetical protein
LTSACAVEAADRPSELVSEPGVVHAHVQASLRPADLLGGQHYRAEQDGVVHDGRGGSLRADQPGRDLIKVDHGLLTRHVQCLQRPPGEAGSGAVDSEEAGAGRRLRSYQDEAGRPPVQDEILLAGQPGGGGQGPVVPPLPGLVAAETRPGIAEHQHGPRPCDHRVHPGGLAGDAAAGQLAE